MGTDRIRESAPHSVLQCKGRVTLDKLLNLSVPASPVMQEPGYLAYRFAVTS